MIRRLPALLLLSACQVVHAAGATAATRLDRELTPVGALRAGNADGSIPAWDGGLTPDRAPAGHAAGSRHGDPYAGETPLFTITRDNLDRYAARLTPGQRALFAAMPDSFAMPVYASHRSVAAPAAWYAGTRRNATEAELDETGQPRKLVAGLPFPLVGDEPADGLFVYWNQRLRWRGLARERRYVQASVSASGSVSLVRFAERMKFIPVDSGPVKPIGRAIGARLLAVLEPARLAGALKLEYDTLAGARPAWQRSPGPERPLLRATTETGNDVAVFGSDGLLAEDQREGYGGGPERYQWRYAGTREIYVPYNAYRLHEAGLAPEALLGPHHLEPGRLRYELHRVRVLDARLKPGQPGIWPRRTLYLDEDSSAVLLVDLYGRDERIERMQEAHTWMAYDAGVLMPGIDCVYDLVDHRYLASGLDNDEAEATLGDLDARQFTPEAAERWSRQLLAAPAK